MEKGSGWGEVDKILRTKSNLKILMNTEKERFRLKWKDFSLPKICFCRHIILQTGFIYLCSNLIGAKNVVNINGTFLF